MTQLNEDQRANDSDPRRLIQIGWDRIATSTVGEDPRMPPAWPPEWPPRPVRRVRITSLSWSPVTESNRRPSPYHGDALPTELTGPIFTCPTWDFAISTRFPRSYTALVRHPSASSFPYRPRRAYRTPAVVAPTSGGLPPVPADIRAYADDGALLDRSRHILGTQSATAKRIYRRVDRPRRCRFQLQIGQNLADIGAVQEQDNAPPVQELAGQRHQSTCGQVRSSQSRSCRHRVGWMSSVPRSSGMNHPTSLASSFTVGVPLTGLPSMINSHSCRISPSV